jgi:uncharacterized membrane protein YkvA (DUF1232 family)
MIERLKTRARALKQATYACISSSATRAPPWYTKLLAAGVVAYALSPFDLIPDFIPVIGYLDDLILVPSGIALVLKLVPVQVMTDCRPRPLVAESRPVSRVGAVFMIAVWLAAAGLLFLFLRDLFDN